MFGYISIYFQPTKKEIESYLYYYCGLCHILKQKFGETYRPIIIREVVFFSMIKNPMQKFNTFRCPYTFFKERYKPVDITFLEPYSYLNLLIIYGKLLDYKLEGVSIPLKIVNKIKNLLITFFDEKFLTEYESLLKRQDEIEKQKLDLDEYAKPSQEVMNLIFKSFFTNGYPETMPIVTANLVYLLDSIYDFKKDIKRHKFNALNSSFGISEIKFLTEDQKERLLFTYDICAKEFMENLQNIAEFNIHFSKKLATFSLIYHRNEITNILYGGKKHGKPNNVTKLYKKWGFQKPVFKI